MTTIPDPTEQHGSIVDDLNVVLAGVDQVSSRAHVNEQTIRYETTFFDAGSRIDTQSDRVTGMQGFVQVVEPGTSACFDCLGRGDPQIERAERMTDAERAEAADRGYIDEHILSRQPSIIHLNSVVASIAVNQFTRLLTGFDDPVGFIRYDGLAHDLQAMQTQRSRACPTCDALLGRGDGDITMGGDWLTDWEYPRDITHDCSGVPPALCRARRTDRHRGSRGYGRGRGRISRAGAAVDQRKRGPAGDPVRGMAPVAVTQG